MFKRFFVAHPSSVGESYGEHLFNALCFAGAMLIGAAACLVHAIFPSIFVNTGSSIIKKLHDRMIVNRAKIG